MVCGTQTVGEYSPPHFFERYLHLLGVARRKPGYDALTELVRAQLMRIPFETVSKLLYRKRHGLQTLPGLERYLDGIDRCNFGGTCYSNNYYFHLLLVHLGYDVSLCGADMNRPDVHLVNIVRTDGREYLVDAGYAAPFLDPLPRDLKKEYEITLGRDNYILRPQDESGCSRLDMYRSGKLRHGYNAKPIPRAIEHFSGAIAHSFSDEATFMNALLLVRFYSQRSIAIYNLSIIESEGSQSRIHSLTDREDIPPAIEEYFSIPRELAAEALAELGDLGDAWN